MNLSWSKTKYTERQHQYMFTHSNTRHVYYKFLPYLLISHGKTKIHVQLQLITVFPKYLIKENILQQNAGINLNYI